MSIRVLIADDHAVFRSGLRALLEKQGLEVIAEAGSGEEALSLLRMHGPDVLILDISMPGAASATQVVRAAHSERPDLRVVVLTMHQDAYYVRSMFEAGAHAYVVKQSSADTVVEAVRAAARGDRFVDPAIGGNVIAELVGGTPSETTNRGVLTRREQEVCSLLALGHTNAEIARSLGISERTAEIHRAHIMAKIGLQNRAELVRFAIQNGLFKPETT